MKREDNIESLSKEEFKNKEQLVKDITKDITFKCLFGNKGNEKITKAFIENITKKRITDLTLDWKLEMERERIDGKLMIADVIAKDKENKKYIIEMQKKGHKKILGRFVGYIDKVHISDLKEAEDYDKLTKTTLIAIVENGMKGLPEKRNYYTNISYKTDQNKLLKEETQELHIVELDRYKKEISEKGADPWLEFIINPNS